jgi:Na+/proline symporter
MIEISSCEVTDTYSLITLFLYMVAELSALQQIIEALTGLDGLPALIVEAVITAIYTCSYYILISTHRD